MSGEGPINSRRPMTPWGGQGGVREERGGTFRVKDRFSKKSTYSFKAAVRRLTQTGEKTEWDCVRDLYDPIGARRSGERKGWIS